MSSPETTQPDRTPARPERRKRRRWIALTLGLLVLLAAVWTIAWQVVALQVEAAVDRWIAARRALGDHIEHGPIRVGGFPLAVELTASEVHWTRQDPSGTLLTAAAPGLVANAPVWQPMRVTVRPATGARASAAGAWGSVTGDAADVVAVLTLGRRQLERIELAMRALDMTGPGGALLAEVDAVDAVIDPDPEEEPTVASAVPTTLTVALHASGVRPAGTDDLPFEGPATVTLSAALRGPVDPLAGVPGLALWRDAGGVIDVDRLAVSWSPVDLVGDGTFALDAALRPEGAGTAEIKGVAETLDRLVLQGRMKANQAALLKLAVIAASEPAQDGSGTRLKAPVTVQDGTIRLGQFAIGKVKSIAE